MLRTGWKIGSNWLDGRCSKKTSPATWKWNKRTPGQATILSSRFLPLQPCNALRLPRVCPHPDRAARGSCGRRELGCLVAENLQPLPTDREKCVRLHDISAALGTLARVHGGSGSSARYQLRPPLQPLRSNKASRL